MTLTTAELADIRAAVTAAFPDTCTIKNRMETNVKGSVTDTWPSDSYTGVACRLMPVQRGSRLQVFGEKTLASAEYVLTVSHDQAIVPGDRVVHGGVTYEVLKVHVGHSYRTACRAALARVH
jgi:hypothetical protein